MNARKLGVKTSTVLMIFAATCNAMKMPSPKNWNLPRSCEIFNQVKNTAQAPKWFPSSMFLGVEQGYVELKVWLVWTQMISHADQVLPAEQIKIGCFE